MLQSCLWRNKSWWDSWGSLVQCLDRWTRLSSRQQRWLSPETGREGTSPCFPLLRRAQGPHGTQVTHTLFSLCLPIFLCSAHWTGTHYVWEQRSEQSLPISLSFVPVSRSWHSCCVHCTTLCPAKHEGRLTLHIPNPSWGLLLYICTWVVLKSRPCHFSTQDKRFSLYIKDYIIVIIISLSNTKEGHFTPSFPHLSIEPFCQAQTIYSSSDVCSMISQTSVIFKGTSLQSWQFLSMEWEGSVTVFLLCPQVPLLKRNNL